MKIPIGQILVQKEYLTPFELVSALDAYQALPEHSKLRLGDVLISLQFITKEQLQEALDEQKSFGSVPIGHILVQEKVMTEQKLEQLLALQKKVPPERRKKLGEMVIEHRIASPHRIERALAEYYKKRKRKQVKVLKGLNVKRIQS